MSVEELLERLEKVEDKSKKVILDIYDDNNTGDFSVYEYDDVVKLEENY